MPMPTLASKTGDAVSVRIDQAGALETAAVCFLREGNLARAVLALRRAQHELLQAELVLLERVRVENLKPRRRRAGA